MNLDREAERITQLRQEANQYPEDSAGALLEKIKLLVQMKVHMGRVSSWLDETSYVMSSSARNEIQK